MNAYVCGDELAVIVPQTLTHSFEADTRAPAPKASGLLGRLAAAWRWVRGIPRRQAVIAELRGMSVQELADIGLTRSYVSYLTCAPSVAER